MQTRTRSLLPPHLLRRTSLCSIRRPLLVTTRPQLHILRYKTHSVAPLQPHLLKFKRVKTRDDRRSSTMSPPRNYNQALSLLESLQSNKHITSLFPPQPIGAEESNSSSGTQDLNALAIPEMRAWMARAGITTEVMADGNSFPRCIHVAGTKGKGSVCAYITSILTHPDNQAVAGKVGTYTSPHLLSVRERIQIQGKLLSQEKFAKYFFEVWDALTEAARAEAKAESPINPVDEEHLAGPATKPFYFRFLTILAFHIFRRENVRSAVIECGIGGEYDSTNVLPAEAVTTSVITELGIDHENMLGNTVPKIAWHKAGVMKKDRKCFTRKLQAKLPPELLNVKKVEKKKMKEAGKWPVERGVEDDTMDVIKTRAEERGAVLVTLKDQHASTWTGAALPQGRTLGGRHQRKNQALAAAAAREHLAMLTASGGGPLQKINSTPHKSEPVFQLPYEPSFQDGLASTRLRGRCEVFNDPVQRQVTWHIDGAHTDDSLEVAARWFVKRNQNLVPMKRRMQMGARSEPLETVLIFNQQDRDVQRLLPKLLRAMQHEIIGHRKPHETAPPIFNRYILTRNDRVASSDGAADLGVQMQAMAVIKEMEPKADVTVMSNVTSAVEFVRQETRVETTVLVTGSFHLVSAFLRVLDPEAEH